MSALADAVRAGDRRSLARAITLVESTRADHRAEAAALLDELMPATGGSTRVGISGAPGAGKSTFIEALGLDLVASGHEVAVLAVDPSSTRGGGSILGDKTRMEHLSRAPQRVHPAFAVEGNARRGGAAYARGDAGVRGGGVRRRGGRDRRRRAIGGRGRRDGRRVRAPARAGRGGRSPGGQARHRGARRPRRGQQGRRRARRPRAPYRRRLRPRAPSVAPAHRWLVAPRPVVLRAR